MKKILISILCIFIYLFGNSQTIRINKFLVDSMITANHHILYYDSAHNGTWQAMATRTFAQQAGGGGSGTVTSVSGLSPLFTTANATTTPTFSLSNTTQYTVFGRSASGSGVPSYVSIDTTFISSFYSKVRGLISLTTTGTSGAATYDNVTGILNVPQYSGGGGISRIGTIDSLAKAANGEQISGVSIIPQTADSAFSGLLKYTDRNALLGWKPSGNPTGTMTLNLDTACQYLVYFTSTGGRTLALTNPKPGKILYIAFNNTSGSAITLTLPANSFVNFSSASTVSVPTGESLLSLYLYDGTNFKFIQTTSSTGTAFVQDGNSFGASAVLGTNDNNSLSFEINNSTKMTLGTSATRRLQFGALVNNPVATPESVSLGGDYNNTLGAIPKLRILDDGTNISGVGFGSSGNAEMSFYNSNNAWHFTWYGNTTRAFDITPSSNRLLVGPTGTSSAVSTPWFVSFSTDFSQSPLLGLKLKLIDAGAGSDFGFGVSSGQLNYVAPSTNKHSFYNNGVKQVNIGSAQVSFTNNVYVGDSTTTANSTLQVGGSFATRYDSTAVGLTLNATHHTMGVTATGQTITLPTAVGISGRFYTIVLTATGSCTIATTSSQLIAHATTYTLSAQDKYVTVQSTGANWVVVANN